MTLPPALTERISTESAAYRDPQLRAHLKELRAAVKPFPRAKAALERCEQRLKYVLRTLTAWDATHAERAETLIRLGNLPAANTAALMIFDEQLRISLLGRARIGGDAGADERLAEALEMERTVLE